MFWVTFPWIDFYINHFHLLLTFSVYLLYRGKEKIHSEIELIIH